ncbi:hypothetical protein [Phenylobacterium sp.]|uniref:hypothetical protein n=1 Tax=Phenylobacterium sp. TaxID=1871053 RepID=UPI003D2A77D5
MSEAPERRGFGSSGLWAVAAAVAMLGWTAWENRAEDTAPGRAPYDRILGARDDVESQALSRLMTEAFAVLHSPEFRTNLLALEERYPGVYARNAEQAATVSRIASIVALEPMGSRFAPADVALVDGDSGGLGAAGEGVASGRYSNILIERVVLAAWRRPDAVARSCAINVAAHEYAHTIVLTPMGYGNAFTDTQSDEVAIPNRQVQGSPVASYLIGSVAQCTWLAQQGRIERSDVGACVQVFGTAAFNWDRCRQFAGGEPVASRPGLAPPAPPL